MLISIAVIGILTGIKNPNANLLQGTLGDAALSDFAFSSLLEKPYCRINSYVVLGFVLHKQWRVKSSHWVSLCIYIVLWMIAVVFCVTIVFGQYQTWNGHPFSKAENVMYFMFSSIIYSTGIALMVYAYHNGYGVRPVARGGSLGAEEPPLK